MNAIMLAAIYTPNIMHGSRPRSNSSSRTTQNVMAKTMLYDFIGKATPMALVFA
jgi:hypothetical protein